jgi:hypothetical protein
MSSVPSKNESSSKNSDHGKMILATSWLVAAGRGCSMQNKSGRASRQQEPKSRSRTKKITSSAAGVCSCTHTAHREPKMNPQAGSSEQITRKTIQIGGGSNQNQPGDTTAETEVGACDESTPQEQIASRTNESHRSGSGKATLRRKLRSWNGGLRPE